MCFEKIDEVSLCYKQSNQYVGQAKIKIIRSKLFR
jgi:hypothetical protein